MPMKRCFHAEGTIFSSNRNLPDQRTIQMFLYFVRRHTMPEQEHQLGNRTFGRAVVTAHHAGLQQFATGFIAVHFHAPGKALGDIDNDDPPFDRILQHLQQPVISGRIPATECFHHDAFQAGNIQDAFHNLRRNSRKYFQDCNIPVQQVMRFQRFPGYRMVNLGDIILNRNTGMCQRRIIIGTERIEIIRIRLAGTVSAQQVVLKENTDFRNLV